MAQPNVLLITCHDIGRHLGCYGVETLRTPCLDHLAETGVRMDRAFCASPTCSPSRAALFTGRWPHVTGCIGLTHGGYGWDLNDDETHLARRMRDAGYRTGLFGIMHESHRFDRWGYEKVLPFDLEYRPDCREVTSKAVDWLDGLDAHEPFFAHVGYFEPHRPFDHGGCEPDDARGVWVPPYLEDDAAVREDLAAFQGAIAKVDASIGRLLEAIDRLGRTEETLVIFSADHGIPFQRAKASLYDTGIGIAMLIRWPGGGWAGGRSVSALAGNIDVVPTVLTAAGLDVPDEIQGVDLSAVLSRRSGCARRRIFAEQNFHGGTMFFDPRRAIRTDRYKLIANFTTAPPFAQAGASRYRNEQKRKRLLDIEYGRVASLELYDLEEDAWEFDDRVDDERLADVQADLASCLYAWMVETGDPLLEGYPLPHVYHETLRRLRDAGGPCAAPDKEPTP